MQYVNYILLALLVLYRFGGDHIFGAWVFVALLFLVHWARFVVSRLGLVVGVASAYVVLNGVSVFVWPNNEKLLELPAFTVSALYRHAGLSTFLFVCVVTFISLVNLKHLSCLVRDIRYLVLFNAVFTLSQFLYYRNTFECGGIFSQASLNASFIAAFYPMVKRNISTFILFLLAILSTGSAVGVVVFICVTAFLYSPYVLLVGGVVSGVVAYCSSFFSSSGRFDLWVDALSFYRDRGVSVLFGGGNGTYGVWATMIRNDVNAQWPWIHNDWLQVYLDLGLVGVFCLACVGVVAYVIGREFRSVFIGIALVMCANYPMHEPRFCVFIALVLGLVYRSWCVNERAKRLCKI